MVVCLLTLSCQRSGNDGSIRVSGNIEVDDARLAFKVPGIIIERAVSEGGAVTEGQVVARLEDSEQVQQVDVQRAELAAAQAALADLEAGSRPQEIESAKAAVASAAADTKRAELEFARQKELRDSHTISAREFEVAQAAFAVAQAHEAVAREQLTLIVEGPRKETINQARARVEQARAALALAQLQLGFTKLVSPLTGVVLSKNIEPGEFVAPGTAVITVADTSKVWLRAFVDETDLGKLHLGQAVDVRTDSFPGKTYHGTLAFIASEAEFTPKTVQTNKERVTLVFRVKINLENKDGELKPGMPADAVFASEG